MDEAPLETETILIVRPFYPEADSAFLYSTWRNSSYYSAASPHQKENNVYFKELTKRITHILKTARVRVACLQDDHDLIIGYVVYQGAHLNWIYVKDGYRKMGIGRKLMPNHLKTCTDAPTQLGVVLAKKLNLAFQGDQHGKTRRRKKRSSPLESGIQNPSGGDPA